MGKLYWLSEGEWARIAPLLPRGRRGAHRVDDRRVIRGIGYMLPLGGRWRRRPAHRVDHRRVISGIVHMLRSGVGARDCPTAYGPYTTIYNRFNRWSRQGVWSGVFAALTGSARMIGGVGAGAHHNK